MITLLYFYGITIFAASIIRGVAQPGADFVET